MFKAILKGLAKAVEWTAIVFTDVEWKGWYEEMGQRKEMVFRNFYIGMDGKILGEGQDQIGKFTINGHMDMGTGFAQFVKQYKGKHAVNYQGSFTDGAFRGSWTVAGSTGSFELRQKTKEWRGWYEQNGARTDILLHLSYVNGKLFGMGNDEIGRFTIRGQCDGSKVHFIKKYFGQHQVIYEGKLKKIGTKIDIRGHWEIPGNCGGLFELVSDYYSNSHNTNQNIPSHSVTHNSFPGQQGGFPGQMNSFPGQQGGFPGQMNSFPGQQGGFPGQMNSFPGQQGGFPGQMNSFPGQQGGFPGQQGGFPGQQGGFPGQQGGFPGQQGGFPGQQGGFPGQQGGFPF